MKKILLSAFLIAHSMTSYAIDSLPTHEIAPVAPMLCNKPLEVEKILSAEDREKRLLISIDYYREYETIDKKLVSQTLNKSILTSNNDGVPVTFTMNLEAKYLVSIKSNQALDDESKYVAQDGTIKKIEYPSDSTNIYGSVYTRIKDNNKVDMKLCLNRAVENLNDLNHNDSIYKEVTVSFNDSTIIDLTNGYKFKINLYRYK